MTHALRNLDAEGTVLGAACQDRTALHSLLPLLRPEDFSLDSNRKIFAAIAELANAGKPVDVLTLTDALVNKRALESVGGVGYLSTLTEKVDSEMARVTNVEFYAGLIRDKARRRQAQAAARNLLARLDDPGVPTEECLAVISDSLLAIEADSTGKTSARHVKEILRDTLSTLETQAANDGLIGMPTGLDSLDIATGGIREGELWVIGALPGRGKTALGLQVLMACGRSGIPACAFSLEMNGVEIGKRILAAQSRIAATQLRNPAAIDRTQWPALASTAADIGELPVWIDDSASLSISELLARGRLYVRQHGVKLFVVDYIRHVTAPGRDLRERFGAVANALRQLAKTEGVGVVLLSQLRRPTGGVNDRPSMVDLKESGDIEADAHVVLLPYLPQAENGIPEPEQQELIIGKNRNGRMGSLPVYFDEKRLQFRERTGGSR